MLFVVIVVVTVAADYVVNVDVIVVVYYVLDVLVDYVVNVDVVVVVYYVVIYSKLQVITKKGRAGNGKLVRQAYISLINNLKLLKIMHIRSQFK